MKKKKMSFSDLVAFHTAGINGKKKIKKQKKKFFFLGTEPKLGYCPFE